MSAIIYQALDSAQITTQFEEIYRELNLNLGNSTYNEPWSREKLRHRLHESAANGLAETARNIQGELIGIGLSYPMETALAEGVPLHLLEVDTDKTFYAAGLFVSAPYRRYGIGSALIRGRMIHFKNRGYRSFASLTNCIGDHISLYKRLGYEFSETPIQVEGFRNPKLLFKGSIEATLRHLDETSHQYKTYTTVSFRPVPSALPAAS